MFTHYEDMKGDEKCNKWGGLGLGVTQGHRFDTIAYRSTTDTHTTRHTTTAYSALSIESRGKKSSSVY